MRFSYQIYGTILRMTPEILDQIRPHLPFEVVELRERTLHLEHENSYLDVEEALENIVPMLPSECTGRIDFIDHLDWVMYRYEITPPAFETKAIDPDAVLERYSHE